MYRRIECSNKRLLRILASVSLNDARSIPGRNSRLMRIITGEQAIGGVSKEQIVGLQLFQTREDEEMVVELLEGMMTEGEEGNLDEEDQSVFDYLCTS